MLPIYNCSNPVLKQIATPIEKMDSTLKQLINDMFKTLNSTESGVGLAANQVGKPIAMFIIDVSKVEEYEALATKKFVFINPDIIDYSDETNFYTEGCLSVPTMYEEVERPAKIKIKYFDEDMNEQIADFDGFLARVIQHEYDHLRGILFYEKLSAFKRTLLKNKLKRIKSGTCELEYEMIK